LWQAPLFVLGIAALIAVWFGRPLFPDNPARNLERDLASVREMLAMPNGDIEKALKLAHHALDKTAIAPELAGEAALLVGTAHMRLAETRPSRSGLANPGSAPGSTSSKPKGPASLKTISSGSAIGWPRSGSISVTTYSE